MEREFQPPVTVEPIEQPHTELPEESPESLLDMPYGAEINAAVISILDAHPGGKRLHLREIIGKSIDARGLPHDQFQYFLDTMRSDSRIKKAGKGYYLVRPAPDEKVAENNPSPIVSDTDVVFVRDSLEGMLSVIRNNSPQQRSKGGRRKRLHHKRIAEM